jgi:hypothetical protein
MSIHTCSYFCERHECIKAQRDELRQKIEQAEDAVAAEREACAKVCEDMWHEWLDSPSPEENVEDFYRAHKPDAEDCAKAIRARGET